MWHGYAVTSSTLLADPPSNETIDVFYIKNTDNSKFMICITDIITVTKHASWRPSALFACFGWFVLIGAVVQGTMQFNVNRKAN